MLTQPTRQKTCCGILRKDFEERSDHELTLLSAVMREVPQFQQLDAASLKAICRQMELKRFAKGDVIVQEGDLGNEFYVLITGAVSIYTNRPEEQTGQVPQEVARKLPGPRCVDWTVAQVTEFKTADVKAKSRTVRALNRRISYTVDWDAMEKKAKAEGSEGLEHQEEQRVRRVSAIQGTQEFHPRGSAFTDSESEEDVEDLTLPRSASTAAPGPAGPAGPGRMTRRWSSEKEGGLEEKSPRRGPQLRTAALCPGSSFGELSLLGAKLPRQSTAKCEEKCAVAVLRREVYQLILCSTESSRRKEWLCFAETAPILRHLDESTQLLCEPLVKIQQVSRGEKVVRLGDPVQVFFLAQGVFAVSLVPGEGESSQVTSALMVPPSCFGLTAHSRNDTHFQETLTSCSASGKVYVLQTKHLWMMLSNHQQEALTRAASYERAFQLSHASVMQEMSRPSPPALSRHQLYSPSPRLAALRRQLREQADGANKSGEEGEALRRTLAKSWSVESLQPAAPPSSRSEKLPRTEPHRSVAPEDVPKLRLHSSLLPLWSPAILEDRQSLHVGQHHGVFHGYGPPVQANRFVTQFFKVKSGPWSHACKSSASEPVLRMAARPKPGDGGEDEEFFESFEDDGGMSPLLDAKIKETMRQRRKEEEWRQRAEKAAATLQRIVRQFLRNRKKQNLAASCIQRAFRARKENRDTPSRTSAPGTPSATSEEGPESHPEEALVREEAAKACEDEAPPARHGSILQLDFDTAPKLQDLKKALGRASTRRSVRLSKVPQELEVPPDSDRNVVPFCGSEVPQLFVPMDLIEKHQLLMETQVLEEWPDTQQLSTLKRLRRKWEKLQRKPPANTEVVPAEPVPADPVRDLGVLKLPALPSPRGSMVFSARLSAAHADPAADWNRSGRDFEKDEIDPAEIYRPKPCPVRFRSTLRRYG